MVSLHTKAILEMQNVKQQFVKKVSIPLYMQVRHKSKLFSNSEWKQRGVFIYCNHNQLPSLHRARQMN